jgi:hypothetical protein
MATQTYKLAIGTTHPKPAYTSVTQPIQNVSDFLTGKAYNHL